MVGFSGYPYENLRRSLEWARYEEIRVHTEAMEMMAMQSILLREGLKYPLTKKERPMSFDKAKPFLTEARYGHTSFATLEEALNAAKQNSAKDFVDSAVYQAINLVKAPIPGDIVVEKINV